MISDKPLPEWQRFDVIIVTGDAYADHPLCGAAVIARTLESEGYSVGIIETPDWKDDEEFTKLGEPRLFFGITAGAMDSMIDNYTPLIKEREDDEHRRYDPRKPDRAVIVYANMIRRSYKNTPMVLGGVEASLRRFAHFDYWSNKLRRSILPESRADILAYGNAEYAVAEIARRFEKKEPLDGIEGTCIARNNAPHGFRVMPSFEDVASDKKKFCRMQMMFNNDDNLAQKTGDKFILQYKSHRYTTEELDHIYELNYSRDIPEKAVYLKGMQFSVVTHRGCIGNCSFCSIALHQGTRIVSRSEASILREIQSLVKHRDFKGYIDDLGGPSANMYGMDCHVCKGNCLVCNNLDRSHSKLIMLMEKAREIPGVKKIFVRSGIRYDLALESRQYIKEISKHHISGYLKIAPEHCSPHVLKLMNKHIPGSLEKFVSIFKEINKDTGQSLKYYVIAAHPGSTRQENEELKKFVAKVGRDAIIQTFTPTPMSMSTCMYYTGTDPRTGKDVYVPRGFRDKKVQKNELMFSMHGMRAASIPKRQDQRASKNKHQAGHHGKPQQKRRKMF
jgi:uncharacterized radical SAM protein YgiQ